MKRQEVEALRRYWHKNHLWPTKPFRGRGANVLFYAVLACIIWPSLWLAEAVLPPDQPENLREKFELGLATLMMVALLGITIHLVMLSPKADPEPLQGDELRLVAELAASRVESVERLTVSWIGALVVGHAALLGAFVWTLENLPWPEMPGPYVLASILSFLAILTYTAASAFLSAAISGARSASFVVAGAKDSATGAYFKATYNRLEGLVSAIIISTGVYVLSTFWSWTALLAWLYIART